LQGTSGFDNKRSCTKLPRGELKCISRLHNRHCTDERDSNRGRQELFRPFLLDKTPFLPNPIAYLDAHLGKEEQEADKKDETREHLTAKEDAPLQMKGGR
jgi:hypothetical protein